MLLVVLVPVVLGLLCLAPCVPNDVHLLTIERQYRSIPHPADSRALQYEADLGLLEGNGNHCDYFVGELRATRLSRAQLARFYGPHVELTAPDSFEAPSYVSSPRDRLIERAATTTPGPGEVLYVVSLFDQEAAGLDMRCH